MPIYVYEREDGSTFEIEQRITADPLTHCPTTGQKVKRVISGGTGLIFKGSGFYLTDYVRNGKSAASVSDSSPSSASGSSGGDKSDSPGAESDTKKDSKKSDQGS
jgi:putative FmdB family regulatory protein